VNQNFALLVLTIIFSYIYAFVGGFTDAANAIATSIGSRVLSPRVAIVMAGTLEIIGALSGTAVALTIGKGIVSLQAVSLVTVLAALIGSMLWSLFTYYWGIPVSETHGLIGALIGAAIAVSGSGSVFWHNLLPILVAIFVSPLAGFLGGAILIGIICSFFASQRAQRLKPVFNNLQRLSSAFMALSHGRNDAQKPMGVLVLALALYFGWENPEIPLWVIISVGLVAGAGVAYGGWRIIKTLGMRITPLEPVQGFAAETSAALVLQVASFLGIPVSTTHTITSSIVGVGAARRISCVRWGVAFDIVLSWILTLPATIFLGFCFSKILTIFFLD